MKRLLRSVIDFDGTVTPANLTTNFQHLVGAHLEWDRPDDKKLYEFVKSYFQQRLETPQVQTVVDYFSSLDDVETLERLKDVGACKTYTRTGFTHLVATIREERNLNKLVALCNETRDIATKGVVIQATKETLKGLRAGIVHFTRQAHELITPEHNGQLRGNFRDDGKKVFEAYEQAEMNKALAWGKFCGINDIDKVVHGIRRGQLWLHAAFTGELKSTFALNWCYNLVTRYRTNVLYISLEMPYEQIRLMAYVMHSTHARFRLAGYPPLDYERTRDGQLAPVEKEFFKLVIEDLCNNPEYGDFHCVSPDDDVTIKDIKLEAELYHQQSELGLLVIDHGGIVEPEKAKRGKDYTIELNSVLRGAKKLAMHFNHGEKIPVLLLFQINREGKDAADKAAGRYKLRALSYANEAERSADIVTTTYLNDDMRKQGHTAFDCLKRREGPKFEPFTARIHFPSLRMYNMDPFRGADGQGMTIDDHRAAFDAMGQV